MNQRKQRRRFRVRAILGAVVVAALTLGMAGFAFGVDNLNADGDGLTPIANNSLALGSVCPGASVSPSAFNVLLNVDQANTNTSNDFANSASITVSVGTITQGAEGTLAASMNDSSIVLPSDWNSPRATGKASNPDTASATVSLTAGSTPGNYNGTVQFSSSGAQSTGGTLTRNHDLPVSWTVLQASDPSCGTTNSPPTADAGGPYSGNEGAAIQLDGSASSDSDGSIPADGYAWTVDTTGGDTGISCDFSDPTIQKPTITCNDDSNAGTFTVGLVVTDDQGASSTQATTTLTVYNVAPALTLSNTTGLVLPVGSTVTFGVGENAGTATYTEPGTNDDMTCSIDWNYPSSFTTVTATPAKGPGACTGANTYNSAGVYDVAVKVADDDGGSDTQHLSVVIYDPSAGFATGGGWIDSPGGALKADNSVVGKAHFGFVSKYLKGATVPTGNTEFQFQAGGLNFSSSSYDWLVVNGPTCGLNAQFKGWGTLNGVAGYGFMIWGKDSSGCGTGYDTFRIQIWDSSNTVVYDNGVDSPVQGSIIVHKGK